MKAQVPELSIHQHLENGPHLAKVVSVMYLTISKYFPTANNKEADPETAAELAGYVLETGDQVGKTPNPSSNNENLHPTNWNYRN